MPERMEDVAREAFGKAQSVLFWILFGTWLLGWGALTAISAALGFEPVMQVGGAVLAGSAALWIVGRTTRRLVLRRRARRALTARARLDGLGLNRDAEAVLGAFDHSYQRALGLLASPELSGIAAEAQQSLDRVRNQLYEVVAAEMRLRRDAKRLRRLRAVDAVNSALGEAEQQMRALHEESDRIAQDAQRLADRLDRVRQLAAGPAPGADARESLSHVLEDLDRTADAYDEIERERLESAEARAQRLMQARAAQKT